MSLQIEWTQSLDGGCLMPSRLARPRAPGLGFLVCMSRLTQLNTALLMRRIPPGYWFNECCIKVKVMKPRVSELAIIVGLETTAWVPWNTCSIFWDCLVSIQDRLRLQVPGWTPVERRVSHSLPANSGMSCSPRKNFCFYLWPIYRVRQHDLTLLGLALEENDESSYSNVLIAEKRWAMLPFPQTRLGVVRRGTGGFPVFSLRGHPTNFSCNPRNLFCQNTWPGMIISNLLVLQLHQLLRNKICLISGSWMVLAMALRAQNISIELMLRLTFSLYCKSILTWCATMLIPGSLCA